jgi:hypothetical protein
MVPLSNSLFFALVAISLVIALGFIGWIGVKLADNHGRDLRIVWYLFALSTVTTFIVAGWASDFGAIDSHGNFKGQSGSAVSSLMTFMLDLKTDIAVFGAILAIIVLPQAGSYVLSGLFGCASDPIFVGRAVVFFVWSIVKSFVVASGILMSVAIYGYVMAWSAWSLKGAVSMASLSIALLLLSFVCLFLYRDISFAGKTKRIDEPLRPHPWVRNTRAWMTRKSSARRAA